MKVSRKVGRCSRSSISRRRLRKKKTKSGYRKKNVKTQKGGKQGRGQKRMRARTHKRGKRFHRGGMPDECYVELGKLSNQQLRYKKEGPLSTPETKPFDVTIYGWKFRTDDERTTQVDSTSGEKIDVGCFYGENTAKIVFKRITEKPVTITMEFYVGRLDVKKSDILSSGTAKEGDKVVKYSFDYTDNETFYTDALKLINENREKNKNLTQRETQAKKDGEKQKMEQARKNFEHVLKQVSDMASSDYSGDYSELNVNLFHYMDPNQKIKSQSKVVMVNFKDFKEKQEKLVADTKKAISDSSMQQNEKESKNTEVDTLFKEIIDNQKKLMLATYFMEEAFKGDYGFKVYSEKSSANLRDQINDHKIATGEGNSTYSHVQNYIKKIQSMKDLAQKITPDSSASSASSATEVLASDGDGAAAAAEVNEDKKEEEDFT
jgi:hypothetical protein